MSFGLSRGKVLDIGSVGLTQDEMPSGEPGQFDPQSWFKIQLSPLEIEIGSGKGTFLLQEATQRKQVNFLGIEWSAEFFRYAADRLRRHYLANVKIMHDDATEFICYWCKDSIADAIHLYFSDPWPKKRHHKRRVIQDTTLKHFYRILKPGGTVHVVTDHDELWEWNLSHFKRHANLFSMKSFTPAISASTDELVGTNFERKYKNEGRLIKSVTLEKIS